MRWIVGSVEQEGEGRGIVPEREARDARRVRRERGGINKKKALYQLGYNAYSYDVMIIIL